MAPDTFTLLPCTPEDVESMIQIYLSAFENDYFSSFTFPSTIDPAVKHRWLRERFLGTFKKPELRNFKVVETSTGKMAAWARWGFPDGKKEEDAEKEKDFDPNEWPEGANLDVCEIKFGGLHRRRDELCKGGETYSETLFHC